MKRSCLICQKEVPPGRAKYCSRLCYSKSMIGEGHHNWKGGGRKKTSEGYVRIYISSNNPYFEMASKEGRGGTVLEHRLRMAEHLGRPLRKNETVHHKNGIKDDNRLENLELRNGNHGRGAKLVCSECGSHNIESITIS